MQCHQGMVMSLLRSACRARIARPLTAARSPSLASFFTCVRARACTPSARVLLGVGASISLGGAVLCTPVASCKPAPGGAKLLAQADELFAKNEYGTLATTLRTALATEPDDAELCWRLGRVCKKQADEHAPKSESKKALIKEGLALAQKALSLKEECGPAHKWYAILLSEVGSFDGTSEAIKNSFVVRRHFERAVELSPADATARHLLGLWCFEVAKLSWIEQKAAAIIFATPPKATFEEAIEHFEAAEQMDPGFYPKNLLLLAQSYARLGKRAEAAQWHAKCLAAKVQTPEDEQTLVDAAKFKP